MYSKDNLEKGNKINMRFYLLQEIKNVIHFLILPVISTLVFLYSGM